MTKLGYPTIDDFEYKGETVIARLDINSPIDPDTKEITNDSRIKRSIPTVEALTEEDSKLVLMAHQGDTRDYHNLVSLAEHAEELSEKIGKNVQFIDDVAGLAARKKIKNLGEGDILLLDNLRYLTEEVSTFPDSVKLTPKEMTDTYLIRNLAPLADYYVNDAFAAAHRPSPSMVAFQELLPSAVGRLFIEEIENLTEILENPSRPCVFLLGGAKVSDSFSMMGNVLSENIADYILTTGLTGNIMTMAKGIDLGNATKSAITERGLEKYVEKGKDILDESESRVLTPEDFAVEENGERKELKLEELPAENQLIDIGHQTIEEYGEVLRNADSIFVNGPAGVYEREVSSYGTKKVWEIISESNARSVIGGGDTVASAERYIDTDSLGYVSTGGGALARFASGIEMPLMKAMKRAKNTGCD